MATDRLQLHASAVAFGDRAGLITGKARSGKSTLANLICRMFDSTKGQVRIDGHDIRDFNPSKLRGQIGYVPQDVFLFSNTIEENINLGNYDITRKEIYQAAELVGAKSFIERLPGKLSYNVMERGATPRTQIHAGSTAAFHFAMTVSVKVCTFEACYRTIDITSLKY